MAAQRSDPEEQHGPVVATLRLFGAQLAAVIGIAALIAAVVAVLGADDGGQVRAGAAQSTATATPAPDSSATTPGNGSSASPSTAPSDTASTDTASTATSTTAPETPPGQGSAATAKVDVLNQSLGNGAGGRVADRLREAGWTIGRVDDFRGNVSTTTVYWLEQGQRRQARQVARFLGGVRVQEGFSTLKDGRVSVILVDGPY